MGRVCKYHPLDEAAYSCQHCEIDFCQKCSKEPVSNSRNAMTSCFICESNLERLDTENDFVPFWRKLPEIHQYPLASSGLIAIFTIAFAMVLLVSLHGLFVVPVVAVMTLYGFTCLKSSAQGEENIPDFSEAINGNVGLAVGLLGILILISFLVGAVFFYLGDVFGIVAYLLAVIAVPAIIMLLSVEESVISALNISNIFRIIWVCGISYGLMLLFIVILSGSMEFLNSIFEGNSKIVIFITTVISNYYFIVIFHLMGYMLFQNSRALDFDVDLQDETLDRSQEQLLAVEAEILIKEGEYASGTRKYYQYLQANKKDLFRWQKYFQLVIETRNVTASDEFAEEYFQKLISVQDEISLVQAYLKIKKMNPKFQIKSIPLRIQLAKHLFEANYFKSIVNLLQNINQLTDDKTLISQGFTEMSKAYQNISGQEHKSDIYKEMSKQLGNDGALA